MSETLTTDIVKLNQINRGTLTQTFNTALNDSTKDSRDVLATDGTRDAYFGPEHAKLKAQHQQEKLTDEEYLDGIKKLQNKLFSSHPISKKQLNQYGGQSIDGDLVGFFNDKISSGIATSPVRLNLQFKPKENGPIYNVVIMLFYNVTFCNGFHPEFKTFDPTTNTLKNINSINQKEITKSIDTINTGIEETFKAIDPNQDIRITMQELENQIFLATSKKGNPMRASYGYGMIAEISENTMQKTSNNLGAVQSDTINFEVTQCSVFSNCQEIAIDETFKQNNQQQKTSTEKLQDACFLKNANDQCGSFANHKIKMSKEQKPGSPFKALFDWLVKFFSGRANRKSQNPIEPSEQTSATIMPSFFSPPKPKTAIPSPSSTQVSSSPSQSGSP